MRIQSNLDPARRSLRAALLLAAIAVYSSGALAGSGQLPIPAGVALKSWQDNGRDGRYLLQLTKGRLPKAGGRVTGTVTSDTDCDADAQGLSHCHNTINLADGSEITVIDTHNMHRNRCLGKGDQITLTTVGKSWIMGTLAAR